MIEVLPPTPVLLAFLAAASVLAVTPGPGVIYIVTRTLTQGRGAGLASVAGVALGNFGNAAGASLGLAAVLATSALAFAVVKYAGAAYLFYLGVQALRRPRADAQALPIVSGTRRQILQEGLLVALLNPKTALFFTAFLPQFMQPAASPVGQALFLSFAFVAIAAVSDAGYVLLAGSIAPALRARGGFARHGRFVAAAIYFGLGLYASLSGSRTVKA